MSVVTKTGDEGKTGLLSGERVSKSDPRVEAYGTLDELVSFLGSVRSQETSPEIKAPLKKIQIDLFRLGAELASLKLDPRWNVKPINKGDISELESWVFEFEPKLDLPKAFVLPGGTPAAAAMDIARSVARRLERKIVGLVESGVYQNLEAIRYVNRLSDLFFIFARLEQKKSGVAYEPV